MIGVLSAACVGSGPGGGTMPTTASRCRVGSTQSGLIVTEWAAAEKANLESLMSGGAVAVEYTGCAMRLVPECQLPGAYAWQPTTASTDIIEIRSEAELFAKLPLGALSLSGELKQSGALYLYTTVVGQRMLQGMTAPQVPNSYECSRATHVVTGMATGAFVMSAGTESSERGSAGAHGVEAGGAASRSARVVRYAGNPDACYADATAAPPPGCGSPIQVFLSPIPGKAEVEGPAGSVKVDFVSGSGSVRWDVYVDDEASCTTPCSQWVDPARPLVLRSREDAPDKLRVGGIDPSAGPVQIVATPMSRKRLATGITFTSLGGMAVVTGIALMGVGCSDDDRDGMCDAGVITGLAGAAVTIGGIYLIRSSFARYHLQPIFTAGPATIELGPGYVAGTF